MQRNPDYEAEVNLKSLFFSVLYRWRSILAAALIGAVLLGVYQFVSLETVHRKGERTEEERQYEIDLQAYHASMDTFQADIETYTNLIAARKEYRNNSPYLKLDPQKIWFAEKRYYVEVDPSVMETLPAGSTIDPADYVLSVYSAAMRERLDDAELEEVFGTSNISYVNELILVSADQAANTITVTAKAASREKAEKELDCAVARIEELREGKAQEINPHKLISLNENITLGTDDNLLRAKNQIKADLEDYQKKLDTAIKGLNDLEIKEEPEAPGNHIKKMAAIGFLLGAFLLTGIYTVKALMSGKLNDSIALIGQYGVPVFGEFYHAQARHPGKAPDKWLVRWEQGKTTQDDESVTEHIAALIRERAADGTLLLVSTGREEALTKLRNSLSEKLGGREIACCADFLHHAGAVTAASRADAVLLVEEKGVSYLKNIDRMAELLNTCEAKVVGAIVL